MLTFSYIHYNVATQLDWKILLSLGGGAGVGEVPSRMLLTHLFSFKIYALGHHRFCYFPTGSWEEWVTLRWMRWGGWGWQGFPTWGSSMGTDNGDTGIHSESTGGIHITDESDLRWWVSPPSSRPPLSHPVPPAWQSHAGPSHCYCLAARLPAPSWLWHYWTGFDSDSF